MHASKGQSLPITEEQLALLDDTHRWLEEQIGQHDFGNVTTTGELAQ
jgi:hypothetical protein